MIKSVYKLIKPLIREKNILFNFIDVGSRNGVLELSSIAEFVNAFGFEPHPEEYQKLLSGQTDAYKLAKISTPRYKSLNYYPYALSDKSGRDTFFLTKGPGVAGLLEPDIEYSKNITYTGKKHKKSFGHDIFTDYKKIEVELKTLAEFASENSVDYIDYLKIDVEGSEYDVLKGAGDLCLKPQ